MSKIGSFLRYNGRHNFYHHPSYRHGEGARIVFGWSLNPISSVYDGKQRSYYEPLWLFRLRQRLFAFAGRQRCPRRGEQPNLDGRGQLALPDTWNWGPDGNRTCSYCGSIHLDDLMKICRFVLADEDYAIEGTTKSYKVYLKQPGVRNAGEGAIKFYMHHAPVQLSWLDRQLFAEAVRISNERFSAKMAEWRAGRAA